MLKRRFILPLILLITLTLIVAGCASKKGDATDNKNSGSSSATVIKFAHNGPSIPEHPMNVAANKFKELVEKNSNGQLKVEIYPAGQLGDARTIVEGVQMGTIEMGDVENGPMGRFVPAAMLWDLPYLFRDLDHAHKVLDGSVGQKIANMYLEKGIRLLAYNDGGFRYFTNNKRPINTPDDMKGLKIRVMESEVMIDTINAFGATAVPMAFGEVYTALQQGTVDGQENPLDLIDSQKFYEVQDYLSLSEHFYYPRQYIISENFYNALSSELQGVVADAAKEACRVQREELAKYSANMLGKLKEAGMQVNEVEKEPFMQIAKEKVYKKFYGKIGNGDEAAGKALIEEVLNVK
ncbi:MAG: DctP family TRAP transporter solute-binding subunit [Firmicutes bacterium]|nr:DctP family TRAP transporter solute-binding subunit [Bacillota bacterium]